MQIYKTQFPSFPLKMFCTRLAVLPCKRGKFLAPLAKALESFKISLSKLFFFFLWIIQIQASKGRGVHLFFSEHLVCVKHLLAQRQRQWPHAGFVICNDGCVPCRAQSWRNSVPASVGGTAGPTTAVYKMPIHGFHFPPRLILLWLAESVLSW